MTIPFSPPRRVLSTGCVIILTISLVGCSKSGTGAAASDSSISGSALVSSTTPTSLDPATTLDASPPTLAPFLQAFPQRVYVPNGQSDTVSVIDPATRKVVKTFTTSKEPQHIVPSYDLRTLWVLDNAGNDLIPIDPATSKPGIRVPVEDPYNLYFTPDGADAIVVAEAKKRLDFRDPQTMALRRSLAVPECGGVNHIDYPADNSYLIATCEFSGRLAKIDYRNGVVLGMLDVPADPIDGMAAMPQDIRMGPDGTTFYVADMTRGGLYVVDGSSLSITGFIPTGIGTHGITPSRDRSVFYVANRGSRSTSGTRNGQGSVSVVDPTTGSVKATWPVPGGGSPDMGNLSTDGTQLWLSGRFDDEIYVFDLVKGGFADRIKVESGPHGLTFWPQPGHYSLGHTGNMR